jgi:rhamnosyltransferase
MHNKTANSIIPIIIWYNPRYLNKNFVRKNIETYLNYFQNVIIIDNSESDNEDILPAGKIIYLPNFENLGIARALNQGCKKAIEIGYKWVLTMDQDSCWENDDLQRYLAEVEKFAICDKNNISFSPDMVIESFSVLSDIKKYIKNKIKKIISKWRNDSKENITKKEYVFVNRVMTSGNIINLTIWENINGFNEHLFIDEVDHEFCYRLRNQGYNIIKINICKMYHFLGISSKRYFFPHCCRHEGIRLYYIMRNLQYMKRWHRNYFNEYKCQSYINRSIIEKIIQLKFIDLKYIYQGIKDANRNIFGKYKYGHCT